MASFVVRGRNLRRTHIPLAICCLVGLLALAAPSLASATSLPSVISENTTLTPAANPYTGGSTIEPGVTLTVKPGARFVGAILNIKGTLDAEGTVAEPIVFTESTGHWVPLRSEERRVGKECYALCRSRWSPYH